MAFRYDEEMVRDSWEAYEREFPTVVVVSAEDAVSEQGTLNYRNLAWEDKVRKEWRLHANMRLAGWILDENTNEYKKGE